MATVAEVLAAGLAHHRAGRLADAERVYRAILGQLPDQVDALHFLAVLKSQQGAHGVAEPLLRRAIVESGGTAELWGNLGAARQGLDDRTGAAVGFGRALALDPANASQFRRLASALSGLGRWGDARRWLERAAADPTADAGLLEELAAACAACGDHAAAAVALRRALVLAPALGNAWHHLPGLLAPGDPMGDAALARTLVLDPADPARWRDLAYRHHTLGRLGAAAGAYRALVCVAPDDVGAARAEALIAAARDDRPPRDVRAALERWSDRFARPLARSTAPHGNHRDPERRLRMGYVAGSTLLGTTHANVLLAPFEAHDRVAHEVVVYSDLPPARADSFTQRYRAAADLWRDTGPLDDAEFTEQLRADRIDVLIDLTAHLGGPRALALARRPAPVQTTLLLTATSGMAGMDYAIADARLVPENHQDQFSEQVVRAPWGYAYQPLVAHPPPAAPPVLSRGHITFGSFNALAKLGAASARLWAAALAAVPTARLRIKAPGLEHPGVAASWRARLADLGVAPERFDLIGWVPGFQAHLAQFNEIDIALDSFPYGGVTTTCESFLMGVPVVTLVGKATVSRYGLTLLEAVGFTEGIALTPADYATRAAALAADPDRLLRLRRDLPARLAASPLADARGFIAGVEQACRTMWRRWCAGTS
jgi:predicted O-linked N-acetylglucosamine transferase (SPINDLY family)